MKNNDNDAKFLIAAFMIGITIAIAGTLIIYSQEDVIVKTIIEPKQAKLVQLGEFNPGFGITGYLYVTSFPHQSDPANTYNVNLTNYTSWAYEYYDGTEAEMIGETPYDPALFDFLIKMQINMTHGYNSTSSSWELAYFYLNLTCGDLSISETTMTEVEIASNENHIWVHFYLNNGGSGYSLYRGQRFNVTSLKFYAFYY